MENLAVCENEVVKETAEALKKIVIVSKIGKSDIDYDRIAWVIKVRSKDATRINIGMVLVDGGYIVATDGHRLHISRLDRGIENGLYKVASVNGKTIVLEPDTLSYQFPEYKRLIPSDEEIPVEIRNVGRNNGTNGNKTWFMRAVYQMTCINHEYLCEAFMPEADCTVKYFSGMKPLVIVEDEPGEEEGKRNVIRMALVMPLKE
jgi:hypothetical protein